MALKIEIIILDKSAGHNKRHFFMVEAKFESFFPVLEDWHLQLGV